MGGREDTAHPRTLLEILVNISSSEDMEKLHTNVSQALQQISGDNSISQGEKFQLLRYGGNKNSKPEKTIRLYDTYHFHQHTNKKAIYSPWSDHVKRLHLWREQDSNSCLCEEDRVDHQHLQDKT